MVEALLKPIESIPGRRSQLDELGQLLIQLRLEDPRVHEHLDSIGVKQELIVADFTAEVLDLGQLHGGLAEVVYRRGQVQRR